MLFKHHPSNRHQKEYHADGNVLSISDTYIHKTITGFRKHFSTKTTKRKAVICATPLLKWRMTRRTYIFLKIWITASRLLKTNLSSCCFMSIHFLTMTSVCLMKWETVRTRILNVLRNDYLWTRVHSTYTWRSLKLVLCWNVDFFKLCIKFVTALFCKEFDEETGKPLCNRVKKHKDGHTIRRLKSRI